MCVTFSPRAAAETDLTCRCRAFQQTSLVVELAPRSHERTAGDQLSVSQAGSPPAIIHSSLVLSI